MKVSVRFKDDVAILTLSGKFLAGTDGPYLRQKVTDLIASGTRKLLFDFAGVPYIDSTGLGFLAGSREQANSAGALIVLCGMSPHVRRILDGVKLSQFFVLADDECAALPHFTKTSEAGQLANQAGIAPPSAVAKPPRARKRPAGASE